MERSQTSRLLTRFHVSPRMSDTPFNWNSIQITFRDMASQILPPPPIYAYLLDSLLQSLKSLGPVPRH
ncbi:hypothetical protein OUZ56_000189 [Daphnia magna]|uniref:Uncharacterized protein n=1 Tax=Daphnia magna TaxID=35525 RepID=A0ABQ9ZYY2_9CRUS|nr:hypothetical protein OUZ56_000189 [Daphnia magna]